MTKKICREFLTDCQLKDMFVLNVTCVRCTKRENVARLDTSSARSYARRPNCLSFVTLCHKIVVSGIVIIRYIHVGSGRACMEIHDVS